MGEDFSPGVGEAAPLKVDEAFSLSFVEGAPKRVGEDFSLGMGEGLALKVNRGSVWSSVKASL